MDFTKVENLAQVIDHTLLKPDAVEENIRKLCEDAVTFGFVSVCIQPVFVKFAVEYLAGSNVKVCTVVGFPTGAHLTPIKLEEAMRALSDGAQEIDMVISIGHLKSGDDASVLKEIQLLADACHQKNALLKVIIETALLNDEEIIRATDLVKEGSSDFVKTSTGFGPHGATVDDVRLIKQTLGDSPVGIKASGGIRTLADTLTMLEAGAIRIGTSSGVRIINELTSKNNHSSKK